MLLCLLYESCWERCFYLMETDVLLDLKRLLIQEQLNKSLREELLSFTSDSMITWQIVTSEIVAPGEAKPRTNKQYADDAHCRSTFVLFSHFNRLKISFVVGAHSKSPTGAPAGGAEEAGSAAAWLRAPLHCPGRLRAEIQHMPFKDLFRNFLSNPPMMESLHDFLIMPLFLEHFEAKSFFTYFSVKLKRTLIYHSMRTWNKIMTAQILIVQVHTQKLSN